MSLKNKYQRKTNVNLFFNQQINIFPEDFFSTFDNNNNTNIEKTRNTQHPKIINLMKLKEISKTNSYNSRNINKNNDEISKNNENNNEISKNNFTNIIKLDNISNIDFSFQAPPSPDKKNNMTGKNHSMSAITKNNSFKPLFRSPLNKIITNETTNKSNETSNKKCININNNNTKKKNKINCYNIKCNELFNETKLKFLKDKKIKKIAIYNQKEKEKNISMLSKGSENNKTNYNNYRLSTPIIKNRVIKKLLNINKSKEIVLKSSSLKKLNDKNKNSIIDTEKKIKNKSKEIAFKSSSLKNFKNKNITNTEKKVPKQSKIVSNINNFNKRAFSSNNYKKNKKENNNSNIDKNNIKNNIKNTINNIFRDLPKDYEDNPVILYKFNSIIRNMKNIQQIIQDKMNSFYNNKNKDETKNNEI